MLKGHRLKCQVQGPQVQGPCLEVTGSGATGSGASLRRIRVRGPYLEDTGSGATGSIPNAKVPVSYTHLTLPTSIVV